MRDAQCTPFFARVAFWVAYVWRFLRIKGKLVLPITLLFGLACRPPKIVYQRVEVPVPVPCPEPPALQWPDLPIYRLTPASTQEEIARAYVASVERLQAQLWQAFRLLDGYRTTTPPAAPRKQP